MRRWLIVVTAAAGVSSGCYFHRTLRDEPPTPNTSVTVTLTADGAGELSDPLGPGAQALDGRVLPSARDTVALAVHRITRSNGRVEQWKGEHVALPRRTVARGAALVLAPRHRRHRGWGGHGTRARSQHGGAHTRTTLRAFSP